MSYINQHEFTGRIGDTPITKYFPSGTVVSKFNIAVKAPYQSETAIWCTCEAWGKLAETAANWVETGKTVSVQAEMKIESWTDKNTGELRTKPVFKVNRLELLSKSKRTDEVVESAA